MGIIREKETIREIPREQRYISKPRLHKIIKGKREKSVYTAMCEAHLRYGYLLKEIAEYNGVHYSIVSRAIRKFVEDPLVRKNEFQI